MQLVRDFQVAYRRAWGGDVPACATRKSDGKVVGYENWLDLNGFLNLHKMLPSLYFKLVFDWMKVRKIPPTRFAPVWYTTDKARDIALGRWQKSNRRYKRTSSPEDYNDMTTPEQWAVHHINGECDKLHSFFVKTKIADPVNLRVVAGALLSEWFWAVDTYFTDPTVQSALSPQFIEQVTIAQLALSNRPDLHNAMRRTYDSRFQR
jgi:hypothetical protein